jgi:hypothetical protein
MTFEGTLPDQPALNASFKHLFMGFSYDKTISLVNCDHIFYFWLYNGKASECGSG